MFEENFIAFGGVNSHCVFPSPLADWKNHVLIKEVENE
jgi:hypothetical protein